MDPRYPIGRFELDLATATQERTRRIGEIERLPAELRAAVSGLDDAALDRPYREGGWTVRQVVHHVADSHLNSYVRFRLALTEEHPTIRPYDERAWAELHDARSLPAGVSLDLLDALHARWVALLRSMSSEDFARVFVHPQSGDVSLERAVALYAWHGRHHTAHVLAARARTS